MVGHSPDSVVSGKPYSVMPWIDQHPFANSAMGGSLGHRVGDHIKVFTIDGQAPGLRSRFDDMPYYGALGAALYPERGDHRQGENSR